jgi:mannosyltransferase
VISTRLPPRTEATRTILLLLVFLGFALRLYHLDYQSLWRDEVDAIFFAQRPWSALLPLLVTPGHNGALYYAILHVWIRLAGDTEFSVRFLSLLCGVAAVPLLFRLARQWLGRGGSLAAALLCATSPYAIWYAQEAKMYALLFLLSVVSTYLYLLALERNRPHLWASYLVTVAASMYVHLLAVLIIPVHMLLFVFAWPRYRGALKSWLATVAVVVLPWLPLARWEVPLLASPFTTGHQFYSLLDMLTVLLFAFSLDSAPYRSIIPIALFVFLLLAGIVLYMRQSGRGPSRSFRAFMGSRHESIALSLYLFLPIAGLYLISLGMPIFTDRYLITALPAFLLLLGCGVVAVRQRSVGLAAGCLAAVLASNLYMVSLQGHMRIKSDFRAAAAFVEEEGQGDVVMFLIPQVRPVFEYYYHRQVSWVDAPYTNRGMTADEVARVMEEAVATRREVWLVVSESELWDSRGLVEEWFEGHGELLTQRSFARVQVYLYRLTGDVDGGGGSSEVHAL